MYNAFIHTIEPKAKLAPSLEFSLHSQYFDQGQSFQDSRLKLDVKFIWSPFVLDSMVKVLKKLKVSKLNNRTI